MVHVRPGRGDDGWDKRKELHRRFDEPFGYFQQTVGWQRDTREGMVVLPLEELPRVDAPDQRLEIRP